MVCCIVMSDHMAEKTKQRHSFLRISLLPEPGRVYNILFFFFLQYYTVSQLLSTVMALCLSSIASFVDRSGVRA